MQININLGLGEDIANPKNGSCAEIRKWAPAKRICLHQGGTGALDPKQQNCTHVNIIIKKSIKIKIKLKYRINMELLHVPHLRVGRSARHVSCSDKTAVKVLLRTAFLN